MSFFKPEALGLCVRLSLEKEQQRLSLEGCGAAGASETKAAPKCSSNAQLTNEQTVGIIFMSDLVLPLGVVLRKAQRRHEYR